MLRSQCADTHMGQSGEPNQRHPTRSTLVFQGKLSENFPFSLTFTEKSSHQRAQDNMKKRVPLVREEEHRLLWVLLGIPQGKHLPKQA